MTCPECNSTIQPGYRGACVTCLRVEMRRLREALADAREALSDFAATAEQQQWEDEGQHQWHESREAAEAAERSEK